MTVRVERRHAVLAALLVVVLVAAGAVVVAGRHDPHPAGPAREAPATSAQGARPPRATAGAFLDSVGVNVHVSYLDTSYGRMSAWLARLKDLGVRHVRDGLNAGNPTAVGRLQALAANGMGLTLITDLGRSPQEQAALAGRFGGAVDAVEAPNEADASGPSDWAGRLDAFLPALRSAVDAVGPPSKTIIGPSFLSLESWKRVAGVSDSWDVINLHAYPAGREPSANLAEQLAVARQQRRDRPIMVTETGYHNALRSGSGQPPVSEAAAATYVPAMALAYFGAGIKRTFFYELADEKPDPAVAHAEQHFGLLRSDLTPKPAYAALRNLLATVRTSPGPGRPRDVRVQAPSGVRSLLLQRGDGSSVLALWRSASVWDARARTAAAAVAPQTATIRFGSAARDVTVSRPTQGAGPVERHDEASAQRVAVGSDVVLVGYR